MKNQKIVVIDYGLGNIYSVVRALEVCGAANICVSSKPEDITNADKLILPGVGAFEDGMRGLEENNLAESIILHANSNKPLLGICLGMQLLASTSDEFGNHCGLDLIPGRVVSIPESTTSGQHRKIPYIGWTKLSPPFLHSWEHQMLKGFTEQESVYLVHSFHVKPNSETNLLATYNYDGYQVTAALVSGNTFGYQFHPEKSGPVGLKLINNFLNL